MSRSVEQKRNVATAEAIRRILDYWQKQPKDYVAWNIKQPLTPDTYVYQRAGVIASRVIW